MGKYSEFIQKGIDEAEPIYSYNGVSSAFEDTSRVQSNNMFAGRLQLLRIMEENKERCTINKKEGTYTISMYEAYQKGNRGPYRIRVAADKKTFHLLETFDYDVGKLTADELDEYCDWLVREAGRSFLDTEKYTEASKFQTENRYRERSIKALVYYGRWAKKNDNRKGKQRYKVNGIPFTLKHAYELCHWLRLSYDQMIRFVERVLPDEAYITRKAEDLIQAYCFRHGKHFSAAELTEKFIEAPMPCTQEQSRRELTEDLYSKAVKGFPDNDKMFLDWLISVKDQLNQISLSSYEVYVKLLLCAYMMFVVFYKAPHMESKDIIVLQEALNIAMPLIMPPQSGTTDRKFKGIKVTGVYDHDTSFMIKQLQLVRGTGYNGIFGQPERDIIVKKLEVFKKSETDKAFRHLIAVREVSLLGNEEYTRESKGIKGAFSYINKKTYGSAEDNEERISIFQKEHNMTVTGRYVTEIRDALIEEIKTCRNKKTKYIDGLIDTLNDPEFFDRQELRKYVYSKDFIREIWSNYIDKAVDLHNEGIMRFFEKYRHALHLPSFDKLNWDSISRQFRIASDSLQSHDIDSEGISESSGSLSDMDDMDFDELPVYSFLLYPAVDENGQWCVENTFSRISDIVNQKKEVMKKDILSLLWMIFMLGEDAIRVKNDRTKVMALFEGTAETVLSVAHFTFYAPHLLEYSILRSLMMGEEAQKAYSTLLFRDEARHLDICIRRAGSNHEYCVRFFGITDRSQTYITHLLWERSEEMINNAHYTVRELEAVLVEVARILNCGWERLPSATNSARKAVYIISEEGLIFPEDEDDTATDS